MAYQASSQAAPQSAKAYAAANWQRFWDAVLSVRARSARREITPEALERALYASAYKDLARRRVDSLLR